MKLKTMAEIPTNSAPNDKAGYNRFLLLVAGLGGLLYGIDIGIIDPALGYLGQTISMTEENKSVIVAAVLGGSMFASVIAGFFADLMGRKIMMIISAVMFVASVAIIFTSQTYIPLLLGRILQGMSGGVIAVVVTLSTSDLVDEMQLALARVDSIDLDEDAETRDDEVSRSLI